MLSDLSDSLLLQELGLHHLVWTVVTRWDLSLVLKQHADTKQALLLDAHWPGTSQTVTQYSSAAAKLSVVI